ncbi:MAG: branched-chain amino acid aminotransferase [Bacteroidetes bacterium]|nr:MAG: branched-chain amino acid aminotransferase [Bacteroidota bacterium]
MEVAQTHIKVQPIAESRLSQIDMNDIPFGRVFSDHMLVARYRDGKWQEVQIEPYGPLPMAPSVSSLNYGQAVFEGMKAHRAPSGAPVLFRPQDNFRRINQSAARLCMPPVPEDIFMDGLRELIRLDSAWVPSAEQGALYIRPLMFATDEYIGVKASESYIFCIFTCPVGPYYAEPVSLLASKDYVRAAIGGTGSAKAAGNYAAALLPDRLAKAQGYNNILWLDGREQQYIEECGTMNVFFVIDDTVITPRLTGTILPGITRNSVLQLLQDHGYKVETRPISIYEVQEAFHEGRLQDAFGTGTAATITHIARIGFGGEDITLPAVAERKVSNWLKDTLYQIRTGQQSDPYGWVEGV